MNAVDDPRVNSTSELQQDVVFGRKMEIEGSAGDARFLRNLIDLRSRKPDVPKLTDGCFEDAFSGIRALASAGALAGRGLRHEVRAGERAPVGRWHRVEIGRPRRSDWIRHV